MQPFGAVTVTVKLPAAETVFVVEILPPPQLNVAPGVVELAVKTAVAVVQFKETVAGLTAAFGWSRF